MLRTLHEYRERKGKPVHCRIGIASGTVFAGALGWLQPRFHLRGPAMVQAEELEHSGLRDTVSVTSDFLQALQRDNGGEGGRQRLAEEAIPAGWHVARARNPVQGALGEYDSYSLALRPAALSPSFLSAFNRMPS